VIVRSVYERRACFVAVLAYGSVQRKTRYTGDLTRAAKQGIPHSVLKSVRIEREPSCCRVAGILVSFVHTTGRRGVIVCSYNACRRRL